jgi:lipopolysaccharide export LptBFGC system permease protein LptF
VDALSTSKIIFNDGSIVEGWQKINFPQTPYNKTYTNCSLAFTTNITSDIPIRQFWIIDPRLVEITKPVENTNTIEKKYEDKNNEADNGDFYKKTFYSLLVLIIVIIIIVICYFILRSRRSRNQSTRSGPDESNGFVLKSLFQGDA